MRHLSLPPVDVLVVGAGPAGLAAALDARRAGASRVVVIDKRNGHSRMRSILLESDALRLMEEWGADTRGFNRAPRFRFTHGYGTYRRSVTLPLPRAPDSSTPSAPVSPDPWDILIRRVPRAAEEIRNIERALLDAARRAGIVVSFNTSLKLAPVPDRTGVSVQLERTASAVSARCRYLVVADGSHSSVNELLGNPREPCGNHAYQYAGGVFASPVKDVVLRWVPDDEAGLPEIVVVANGIHATVYYRRPIALESPGREPPVSEPELDATTREAAASVDIRGALVEGPFTYDTSMDRVRDVAIHPRVLCVGDASRTGDPGFGGNLNEAIRDGRRFGEYYARTYNRSGDIEPARARFREQMDATTTALHAGGFLTSGVRAAGALGAAAQNLLPESVRTLVHLDWNLALRATAFVAHRVWPPSGGSARDDPERGRF